MKSRTPRVTLALLLFGLSALAIAQSVLNPIDQLQGNSPAGKDSFGASVSAFRDTWPGRDWVFVGAPTELSARGKQDGAVYIYERPPGSTFTLFQKILPLQISQGNDGDRLGAGVYAKRGWLFVAVPNYSNYDDVAFWFPTDRPATDSNPYFWFSGRVLVYRFKNGQWQFVQTLSSAFPRREGQFGARALSSHIALSDHGDILTIGEPDTYASTSPERMGFSRLHVMRLWPFSTGPEWCCDKYIDVAQDTSSHDVLGADSVVSLPGRRFAIDVQIRQLASEHNADASSSHGEIWVYAPGGNQFGDILSPIPVQKIRGQTFAAGSCSERNERGLLSRAGYEGMASGGRYFAAAQPCADGAAGPRAGRLDIYRVRSGHTPLHLETSIEGSAPGAMLGSSLAGGQESVAIDSKGCRMLVGSTVPGTDTRLLFRTSAGWQDRARLLPGAAPKPSFGQAVAFPFLPTRALVGIIHGDSPVDKGSVLIYEVPRC